jgi:hypothetical protein
MKLEAQVCTISQGKRFSKLSLHLYAEPLYLWVISDDGNHFWISENDKEKQNGVRILNETHPAYTVAELGILLGYYHVRYNYERGLWDLTRQSEISDCSADKRITVFLNINPMSENLARSDALIWLLESGYIKVENLKL